MVAYVLTAGEADAVRDGQVTAELAPVSKKRHAKAGERMALDVARAGRQVDRMGTPLCVYRARLVVTADGLRRAHDIQAMPGNPWGEAIGFLVRGAEDGAPADHRDKALRGLAQRCGFDGWPALYAAVRRKARLKRKRGGSALTVELIAWGALA